MATLDYGSNVVASCDITEVTGVRALGRYVLRFQLKLGVYNFRAHHAENGYLVWFGGELDTPAGRTLLHPVLNHVGLVEQERVPLFIDAHLDLEQVRLIDDARRMHPDDLSFTLHLRALISVDRLGVQPTYVALQHNLNDSHWIKILTGSGFDERQAIDLLLTYPGQQENLAKAALELQQARVCDRRHDANGTLTHCRRALEHADVPSQLQQGLSRDLTLAERVTNVYAVVRHTLHAGAHVDIGDPTSHDARRALVWTSLILDDLNRLARDRGR